MTTGIVRLVEEGGRVLAVVDPFQISARVEATSFYETVLVACIKEMSRRSIGETFPLSQVTDLFSDEDYTKEV
jgi:hypothetical protein